MGKITREQKETGVQAAAAQNDFSKGSVAGEYHAHGSAHDHGPAAECALQYCGPNLHRKDTRGLHHGPHGGGSLFSPDYPAVRFFGSFRHGGRASVLHCQGQKGQ